MSSAWPSGAPMKTLAAPEARSTCQIALPTTLPASSRPWASTARPWTPVKFDGGTSTCGADQASGRDGAPAQAASNRPAQAASRT
jgi:hypothetical protein